jgi:mannose-6-phosphate isomerase-like protein (cupin superfamily)
MQSYRAINFAEKFGLIREQWSPRVVSELNDYQFKVVRIEGDFIWHDHPETDEAFIVLDGELRYWSTRENGLGIFGLRNTILERLYESISVYCN